MEKNILIAGGTDGIGLAFLKQLDAKLYNKIFVIGRNFTKVEALHISRIVQLPCDITNNDAVQDVLSRVDQPIDQFVNTIGTFYRNPADKMSAMDVFRHFELNSVANINLTNAVLAKLNRDFAEVFVCLASLALQARENYALQSATKAAYKYYLDALRVEKKDTLKVMTLFPSSVNTDVFQKAGDTRDTSKYPSAAVIAEIMHFILTQPREVYIPELKVENFTHAHQIQR